MENLKLILWTLVQLGVIGILWSIPILFWGKVLMLGLEGIYTLKIVNNV